MTLVIDTSVLLAALDLGDEYHDRSLATLEQEAEPAVVPDPVLVELEHLLRVRHRSAAWVGFARDVADGGYDVFHIEPHLVLAAARLQERYADLRIGFVDAAVFLTCVELGETKVATLDRRHFSALRTEDGRALEIVPA